VVPEKKQKARWSVMTNGLREPLIDGDELSPEIVWLLLEARFEGRV
jgi:hypothetical protein